jgi:hypothetical protein
LFESAPESSRLSVYSSGCWLFGVDFDFLDFDDDFFDPFAAGFVAGAAFSADPLNAPLKKSIKPGAEGDWPAPGFCWPVMGEVAWAGLLPG